MSPKPKPHSDEDYILLFDPENPETLLGVSNSFMHTRRIIDEMKEHQLRGIGTTRYKGEATAEYPFNFDSTGFKNNSRISPLVEIAQAFEHKGEYEITRTINGSNYPADKEGSLSGINGSFDFDFEGGLLKLMRNLIISTDLNVITYHGKKRPTGSNLEYCDVSCKARESENLQFDAQFYAFLEEVQFSRFRGHPGSSGWDCDVSGTGFGGSSWGVKYHRINGAKPEDYRYKNGVGQVRCAMGILKDAKEIKFLSVKDTLDKFV